MLMGSKRNRLFYRIRPLLDYCCMIWNPHQVGLTSSLEMVLHRAAGTVKGDYRFDSSISAMTESLRWNLLSDRRLNYLMKLCNEFFSTDLKEKVVSIAIQVCSLYDLWDETERYREIVARTVSYFWLFFPRSIRDANSSAG